MKFIHSYLFVVLTSLSFGLFGQTTVTVGTGTSTDYNFPIQPYFNYGWTSQIYTSAEIGTSGVLNSIAFYINNSSGSYTLDNQKIYMRQTSASQHVDKNYPGTTGFTLVYSGSITIGASGWKTITLTTPFTYSNSSNLEILIESRDGSTFTSAVQTRYTSKSEYRTKFDYNDYAFPTTWYAGGRVTKLPNIQFVINTCTAVAGSVSTTTPTICVGNTASLTLNGQTAGQNIQWQESTDNLTFTDIIGASSTTSTTFTTPALTSIKYYRAKVGSGSCIVYSNVQTISVTALPATPTSTNNGPLCAGSTLNLTANTITGATYAWTGPNSFTSTSQNPSIVNITSAGAGTYSVSVTVNGCTSVAGITSVTVNAIPSTPTAGNNGPICVGSSLSLTANTIVGAVYSWTGPNGFTSTLQNPQVSNSALISMSGDYILTVIVGNCPPVSSTTSVMVKDIPSAPAVTSTQTVCQGETLTLTGESNSLSTYEWTGPNNFSSTLLNVVVTTNASTLNAGEYKLYSKVDGCKSIGSTVSVSVVSKPIVNAGTNSTITFGSSTQIGTVSTSGYTYSWSSLPSGYSSSVSNPIVSPTTNTTYTLLVTNSQGCTNTSSVSVNVVIPPLVVNPTVLNSYCSVENSGAIELTIIGGVPPYTYKWSSGHETKNISGLSNGNYSVEVSDASIPIQKITKYISVGISPEWNYLKGLKYNAGKLLKTATTGNENAWGSSVNSFVGDGWVSYKITSKNIRYMIGFSKSRHKEGNHDLGTPIDYGIEQDYSEENLYKANTSVTYTSYQVGDIIKIAREGSSIKYYKNGVLLSSFTDIVNPETILYLEVTMSDQNSYLEDLKINFCKADLTSIRKKSFAIPKRKLDGNYYETEKGILRFSFDEEYSVLSNSILNFSIYDNSQNLILSSSNSNCNIPPVFVSYGTNEIEIDFSSNSCLTSDKYYIMELSNSKNEKVYLRFKHLK